MLAKMARLHPAIACWEHLHGQQLGLHGESPCWGGKPVCWKQPSLERLASNLCLNCLNLYEMLSLCLTKDM